MKDGRRKEEELVVMVERCRREEGFRGRNALLYSTRTRYRVLELTSTRLGLINPEQHG